MKKNALLLQAGLAGLLSCRPGTMPSRFDLATLRRTGLPLRPAAPVRRQGAAPQAPTTAGEKAGLIDLLLLRLSRPPTLRAGCAAIGEEGATQERLLCLARPLPPPWQGLLVSEQVQERRVIAVRAEEAVADPAAAQRRQRQLTALAAGRGSGAQVQVATRGDPLGTLWVMVEVRAPLDLGQGERGR